MTPPTEALPRLRQGARGPRVKAAKRALRVLLGPDARSSQGSTYFGYRLVRDVILLQHRHGLSVSGVIGPRTWEILLPAMDGYARFLMRIARERDTRSAEDMARDGLVHWAYAIIAIGASRWRYAQVRPYPRIHDLAGDVKTDCSGAIGIIYLLEGSVQDPNGPKFNFNGSGYTGTLRAFGRKISLASRKRGDLIHNGSPDHVHMALDDADKGRKTFSFGSNPPGVRDAEYRPVVMVTDNVRLKGD